MPLRGDMGQTPAIITIALDGAHPADVDPTTGEGLLEQRTGGGQHAAPCWCRPASSPECSPQRK
ncbi:hypothetical protein [Actinomadura sp. 3N508]|uniref:hypothetical protein n=1 Tax=Actinomadura sp. 3N508 TaxID=3375153 RepID=UPI0037BC23EB